jgi:molybdate transport system regulatory protein
MRCDLARGVSEINIMAGTHLSIRIDLASGARIGPGKIALLEAIRSNGSITGAAKSMGMSYRRAWLLVDAVNNALNQPAVVAEAGGRHGGGAILTPVGEQVVGLYHAIQAQTRVAADDEIRALGKFFRSSPVAAISHIPAKVDKRKKRH